MSPKIDEELSMQLERAEQIEPPQEIPVVVAEEWRGNHLLGTEGLKVQNAYENISAIFGVVNAEQVKELTQLHEVEKVECDGQDWALITE